MNAPMPCRVSADLRRLEAEEEPEFTEEELDEARNEIAEALYAGHTCHGWTMDACFDCEMNENEKFIREISAFFRQAGGMEADSLGYDMRQHALQVIETHLPESAVEDRAAQIRADNREAAHG